jgi:hypothetical protein
MEQLVLFALAGFVGMALFMAQHELRQEKEERTTEIEIVDVETQLRQDSQNLEALQAAYDEGRTIGIMQGIELASKFKGLKVYLNPQTRQAEMYFMHNGHRVHLVEEQIKNLLEEVS